jgi:hypothetical protein
MCIGLLNSWYFLQMITMMRFLILSIYIFLIKFENIIKNFFIFDTHVSWFNEFFLWSSSLMNRVYVSTLFAWQLIFSWVHASFFFIESNTLEGFASWSLQIFWLLPSFPSDSFCSKLLNFCKFFNELIVVYQTFWFLQIILTIITIWGDSKDYLDDVIIISHNLTSFNQILDFPVVFFISVYFIIWKHLEFFLLEIEFFPDF